MKIELSKHARQKIAERRINIETLEKVLEEAELLFFDIDTKALIAAAKVEIENVATNLVVIYTKERDLIKVITTYPCKDIDKEIKRKEGTRWIRIK